MKIKCTSLPSGVKLQITWWITYGTFILSISFFEGLCLYLPKDDSKVDAYDCKNFRKGCPTENYRGSTIYERKSVLNQEASGSWSDLIF